MTTKKRMRTVFVLALAAMAMAILAIPAAAMEIPAQLPDPDGKPADMSKPVQVYILLGQSNMVGAGKVGPENKEGTLEHAVKKEGKYPYLIDESGNWTERKDVRYARVMGSGTGNPRYFNNEWITVKDDKVGPELGIGHVIGHVTDAPVLILKSCIGNRSLGWDLLPPGSERYEAEVADKQGNKVTKVFAGYKDSPDSWVKGTEPTPIGWYAGMQYDGDVANAKKVLAELDKYYPGAKNYEVAGFFFWQGDKDRYNPVHASRYEQNLVQLIKQLRKDFNAPNAKFVCATLGQTKKGDGSNDGKILDAQLTVDGNTGKYPEFKGNVATVYSNPLSHGGASNGHYNGNAETYMDIGQAMGWAMAELLTKPDKQASSKEQTELQDEFLKLKFGMFIHFNMATYKGVQWVAGYHSPAEFNPGVDTIDTDAWADAAVSAGMKYGVLTAKHVAGFCLWDSKYTTYDVMHPDCPYQKDLVAQFIKSFKSRGLKAGLYYCWRNPGFGDPKEYKVLPPECDPETHTLKEQNEFIKAQIAELLTKYPDVFYIWNDALDPDVMPADEAMDYIKSIRPDIIASANWWDWGKKGTPYLDLAVTETKHFPEANKVPGETCWCLEQSWFWNTGYHPKKAQDIVPQIIIANSRNANFLLNVAPDKNGNMEDSSIKTLAEIGKLNENMDNKKTTPSEKSADVISGFEWKSDVPKDCPFERSETLTGIFFTGRHSDYHCGDTFYPSWASDGNLYSPWTDGRTDGIVCSSGGENASTGHAVMIGDDPLKLIVKNTSPPKKAGPKPYEGRYPCGSLVHNGIWYYGTYCLGPAGSYDHKEFVWNWPNLGPIPGFQISRDLGKTWTDSPLSPDNPLFPEPDKYLGPVKMGAPHFVDFGQNMKHSPDGKAYLLGMGAMADDPKPRPCVKPGPPGKAFEINPGCDDDFAHANLSWITADQVYLARVTPSPETINKLDAYEFFAGHDKQGKPLWTGDFQKIEPLIEWNNHMGCVTATYVPGLKKYLMCVTDGWPTVAKMTSYILEADNITGPWRMVVHMKDFGEQAYFLNFPSKFISEDGKTLWLCYSTNFSSGWNNVELKVNPPGGRYGLCLHEVKLLKPAALLPDRP